MSEYIIDMGASIPNPNGGLLCANVSQLREEIVRCRDCRWLWGSDELCMLPDGNGDYLRIYVNPDGFCAWGERREQEWLTCKCGESIELGDREYAVCPSCGRTVRE